MDALEVKIEEELDKWSEEELRLFVANVLYEDAIEENEFNGVKLTELN